MDLAARTQALLRRMKEDGVDLLIAASNGMQTLDRPDAVVHLTGYRSLGESFFLLYGDGEGKLIVCPASDVERVTAHCGSSYSCVASDDLVVALASELSGRKIVSSRIATAGVDSLPHRLAQRLFSLVGVDARAFDAALYAADGRKTDVEIERARRAVAIAEQGFDRLLELAQPGMRECDLAVALNCHSKSLGADDNFLMLNASKHNPAVMPSSSRKLATGDVLLTEFTPSYKGQFAQICRTVSIGPPSVVLQEKYDLVVRAMWKGIESIRPGTPLSRVCLEIDGVLQSAGYGEYCKPPHMRRRGHGLGCGSVAPGDVATDNHTILEEDMIFMVHPNQYLPETGYLMCGEPVRVTSTGVETLGSRTAKLCVARTEQSESAPCA